MRMKHESHSCDRCYEDPIYPVIKLKMPLNLMREGKPNEELHRSILDGAHLCEDCALRLREWWLLGAPPKPRR